jgi:hypothetical protein
VKVRLVHCGQKKIACIKAIRCGYGFNLRTAKDWVDKAPVNLPNINPDLGIPMVRELREYGAKVEAFNESSALDKITAASYIQTAATALGEGNLKDTRLSLRSALRLIGDFDEDELNYGVPH